MGFIDHRGNDCPSGQRSFFAVRNFDTPAAARFPSPLWGGPGWGWIDRVRDSEDQARISARRSARPSRAAATVLRGLVLLVPARGRRVHALRRRKDVGDRGCRSTGATTGRGRSEAIGSRPSRDGLSRVSSRSVMRAPRLDPGIVPRTHAFTRSVERKAWVAGTSPSMTGQYVNPPNSQAGRTQTPNHPNSPTPNPNPTPTPNPHPLEPNPHHPQQSPTTRTRGQPSRNKS